MPIKDIDEEVIKVLDDLAEIIGKNMDVVEDGDKIKVIALDIIETKFGNFMWAALIHKKGDFMRIQLLDVDGNTLFEEPLNDYLTLEKRELEDKIDSIVEKMLVKAKEQSKG